MNKNKKVAAKYYKLAADRDNTFSMRCYAFMLYEGDGIEENKEEAARYFKPAEDKGDTESILFRNAF